MRTIVLTDPGVLELNWTWLPTWIGINARLKQELEREISPLVVGREMSAQDLDQLNEQVIDLLVQKCPLPGFRDYLDGLKFVSET